MMQFDRDLHFADEIFVSDTVLELGHLQCNTRIVNRVRCSIDVRERT
jgi:hypothetical protein